MRPEAEIRPMDEETRCGRRPPQPCAVAKCCIAATGATTRRRRKVGPGGAGAPGPGRRRPGVPPISRCLGRRCYFSQPKEAAHCSPARRARLAPGWRSSFGLRHPTTNASGHAESGGLHEAVAARAAHSAGSPFDSVGSRQAAPPDICRGRRDRPKLHEPDLQSEGIGQPAWWAGTSLVSRRANSRSAGARP
jgi:hypothetical protein